MKSMFERNRIAELDKLVKAGLESISVTKETVEQVRTKRNRLQKSLLIHGGTQGIKLSQKMTDCKKYNSKNWIQTKEIDPSFDSRKHPSLRKKYVQSNKTCQSLYCPHCRGIIASVQKEKVEKKLTILGGKKLENTDLHHITGVLGLSKFNETDLNSILKKDGTVWRRIRRRLNKIYPEDSPFVEIVYEFELVDYRFLRNSEDTESPYKKKQIKQLMEDYRKNNLHKLGNKFLYVHFHGITNLSKDQIVDVFKDEYFVGNEPLIKTDKSTGLYIQGFNESQTVDENITKLTSYPFKDTYRFKHSFVGSDFTNGQYFEEEDLCKLVLIYQKIQKRSWKGLFRSVDHLISTEMIKYSNLFPNNTVQNHEIWSEDINKGLFDIDGKSKLTSVYMVDKRGMVFTEGWNLNIFFNGGLKIPIRIIDKKKVDERILTTDELENIGIPLWLEVTKNIYEYDVRGFETLQVKLEELLYPNDYKIKLSKEQYLLISTNSTDLPLKQIKDQYQLSKVLGTLTVSEELLSDQIRIEDYNNPDLEMILVRFEDVELRQTQTKEDFMRFKLMKKFPNK